MTKRIPGTLHTTSGTFQLDIQLADSFLTRFVGLMGTSPLASNQGLLLTRCYGVHSAFMRYPIDVVYLNSYGFVIQCVPRLRPWRASMSGIGWDGSRRKTRRASHTLELAADAIAMMNIRAGDKLVHPGLNNVPVPGLTRKSGRSQSGSAMTEFTIVGPIITMLGLSALQYGMLFFAKSQINYASFMAAREGATANASVDKVYTAYVRALVPMYGGGQSLAELANSLGKAAADIGPNGTGNVRIELLNPTKESFTDWNDPARQAALNTGIRRVIPNSGQVFKDQKIGATSGQTVQDANLLKLRITHGYMPKVPLVKNLYAIYLKWLDPKTDAFHTKLLADGRIPVVTNVTLHMQSDSIEPGDPVSSPGPGNGGMPTNPGDPPTTQDPPPSCDNLSCTDPPAPPPSPPPCNPLLDPHHCAPPPCDITCCAPT